MLLSLSQRVADALVLTKRPLAERADSEALAQISWQAGASAVPHRRRWAMHVALGQPPSRARIHSRDSGTEPTARVQDAVTSTAMRSGGEPQPSPQQEFPCTLCAP